MLYAVSFHLCCYAVDSRASVKKGGWKRQDLEDEKYLLVLLPCIRLEGLVPIVRMTSHSRQMGGENIYKKN